MMSEAFKEWYEKNWHARKEVTPRTKIEYMNIGWNGATESMQAKLDAKDKVIGSKNTLIKIMSDDIVKRDREIEALRGFADFIIAEALCILSISPDNPRSKKVIEKAIAAGLIDESGNPTKLLTGEE